MSEKSENSNKFTIIIVVVLLLLAAVIGARMGLIPGLATETMMGVAGDSDKQGTTKAAAADWASAADKQVPANPQLDLAYVQKLVRNMNETEQQKILTDPALFKQAIENEAINRSVLVAAEANMAQDESVAFLMQRGADNILREAYLNRLIATKLPQDFPAEEKLLEYYEANQSRFVVPERVQVWQIFFQKPQDADDETTRQIEKEAMDAYKKLSKGKADFTELALTRSDHTQSSVNGGYMGLIKLPDLLPEVKDPLLGLKEGELSKPIESESGFHILKRGRKVGEEKVEFQQVEQQIRQLLLREVQLQLRKAIYAQAQKEYPQPISDEKIEEWRLRLKTDTVNP